MTTEALATPGRRARQNGGIPGDRAGFGGAFRQSFPESGTAAAVSVSEGAARGRLCRAGSGADGRPMSSRSRRNCRSGFWSTGSGRGACWSRRCSAPGSPSSRFGLAPSYGSCCSRWRWSAWPTRCFIPPITRCCRRRFRPSRLGRAFSIHTFSGFLGNAVAPVTMLGAGRVGGLSFGLIAAGVLALVAALPLALARGVEASVGASRRTRRARPASAGSAREAGLTAILTPAILGADRVFRADEPVGQRHQQFLGGRAEQRLRHAAVGRQSGADRLSGGAGAGRAGRRVCRRPDPPARRCRGARLCDQCRDRADDRVRRARRPRR